MMKLIRDIIWTIILVIVVFTLTMTILISGCSMSKKAKPCSQCPQYSNTHLLIDDYQNKENE